MKRRAFLSIMALAALPSCFGKKTELKGFHTWGNRGLRDGDFLRPRAIGVRGGELFVIDTTGRVQVFDLDGAYLRGWQLPKYENGTPTGMYFDTSGQVVIPDTHYSRILEYTAEGKLTRSWGSYGAGQDEFIYPTGLTRDKSGNYYISEYGGGAERVHVFDPKERYLNQWGKLGSEPGQFNRAMAIAMDGDRNIFVADTGNCRVQKFDLTGKLLAVLGEAGEEPGQLKFPHDISIGPDNSLYCCEYGAHRITKFGPDGSFMKTYGSASRGGQGFNGPRGVAVSPKGLVFVADTDNHRIVRFEAEA